MVTPINIRKPLSTKKILIDARMVGKIPHGIARYVTSLAQGLREMASDEYEAIFLTGQETPLESFSPFKTIQAEAPFLHWREFLEIPKIIVKNSISLYHSPSFSSLLKCPCPHILTIHDLNHLHYGTLAKKIYYKTILKKFSRQASALLSVSEFSQKEIANWLKIPMENIRIAYNAIERKTAAPNSLSKKILDNFQIQEKKYFFCLSNSKPHKNLRLLTQAYKNFSSQQNQAYPLVLSTSEPKGNGILNLGSLGDQEVQVLLENAAALFFPSIYEGFGLPPLEAAVLGSPLVISAIAPHREGLIDLAPHEAVWIAPQDLHGWTQGFHQVFKGQVSGPSTSSQEKILGRFTRKKLGEIMNKIYKEIII